MPKGIAASEVHAALTAMGPEALLTALGLRHRRNGRHVRFCCPVHGGSEPNARLSERDGRLVYQCHSGCAGQGGDALHLIAAVHGMSLQLAFPKVVDLAARIAGLSSEGLTDEQRGRLVERRRQEEQAAYMRGQALGAAAEVLGTLAELCPLTGAGIDYLRGRGLRPDVFGDGSVGFVADPGRVTSALLARYSIDTLDELGIVYRRGNTLAFARHPLLFFLRLRGRLVYVQGRTLEKLSPTLKHLRWRSMRADVPCLYGVDELERRPGVAAFLCEGPIDTLSARQMWGSDFAAVGILGAGSFRPEWVEPLAGRDVYLLLDPDKAGAKGSDVVSELLTEAGIRHYRPERDSGADINDLLRSEEGHAA